MVRGWTVCTSPVGVYVTPTPGLIGLSARSFRASHDTTVGGCGGGVVRALRARLGPFTFTAAALSRTARGDAGVIGPCLDAGVFLGVLTSILLHIVIGELVLEG